MMNRKEINNKVVEWITEKVKREYADDVSLVLLYGSYINGTANSKSDVDCYFIPQTERAYNLATIFIIDGVGYDLYPIPWERVERIADLQECMLPLIGDARIIYCRNSDDSERFKEMQTKLQNNITDDEYVKRIAREKCEYASELCEQLKTSNSMPQIRKIAGIVIMTLADAVALYNHDYFHFGLKKQFEDLKNNFPDVPENIVIGYEQVVTALTAADIIDKTLNLFKNVCDYMEIIVKSKAAITPNKAETAEEINAPWLAGLYEEISSTFNKIYVCCENRNYILAFLSAVCLQRELDDAKAAGCPSYDLLSCFDYRNLHKLAEITHTIENDFVKLIKNNGGKIKSFNNFEQFIQANL